MPQIVLSDIVMEVVQKDIKNLHLSVHPPDGRVTIAAPRRMNLDTIRVFALTKLPWIKKQQHRFTQQEREAPREFINKESHYFLGKRFLLKLVETSGAAKVVQRHHTLELHSKPGSNTEKRKEVLEAWYRNELRTLALPLIAQWEIRMGVEVKELGIKKMKTKWGACKKEAQRIWLNMELAKKPAECVEYIVVHEMVHLLERNHNERFVAYMNQFLPNWKAAKEELNRLPVEYR